MNKRIGTAQDFPMPSDSNSWASVELLKVNAIADMLLSSLGAMPGEDLTPSEKLQAYVRLRKKQMDADELSLPQIMEVAGVAAKLFNIFTPGI